MLPGSLISTPNVGIPGAVGKGVGVNQKLMDSVYGGFELKLISTLAPSAWRAASSPARVVGSGLGRGGYPYEISMLLISHAAFGGSGSAGGSGEVGGVVVSGGNG